jgi:hypothetical protein
MQLCDVVQVQKWLKTNTSLAEVESTRSVGLVENTRFTNQAVRLYRLLWCWSAQRFSGDYGTIQERYYKRRGLAALNRRIARCQRLISKMVSE